MSMVEFTNVTKRFGSTVVLDGVNLQIAQGEVVVLIGPSGSGKSTLLRCINALEEINGGDLVVDGISVRGGAAKVREIRQEAGMVFQQFNLFPQMTALENVALVRARYGVRPRPRPKRRPARCWPRWAWRSVPATIPASCRAASSSAWRLRARWPYGPS